MASETSIADVLRMLVEDRRKREEELAEELRRREEQMNEERAPREEDKGEDENDAAADGDIAEVGSRE